MAETANVKSASRPPVTPMRLVVITMLLAGALYVRFAPTRRIPSHFNTHDKLKIVWSKPVRSQAISMRFSPDSKYLLVAGGVCQGRFGRLKVGGLFQNIKVKDRRFQLWHVKKQREVERLKAEAIFENSEDYMLLMPDFKFLESSWGDFAVRIMNPRKREPEKIIEIGNDHYISDMQLSPDEKTLAWVVNGKVQFRDAHNFHLSKTYPLPSATRVVFANDSRVVKCIDEGIKPYYVDVKTAKRIPASRATKYFKDFRPRDGELVIETSGNKIELWTWRNNKKVKLKAWSCDLVQINTTELSPDKKFLAVGGLSTTTASVRFYDVSNVK